MEANAIRVKGLLYFACGRELGDFIQIFLCLSVSFIFKEHVLLE